MLSNTFQVSKHFHTFDIYINERGRHFLHSISWMKAEAQQS